MTAGCFSIAADAEDGRLRLIDDGRPDDRAEHAGVGDSERALLDLVRTQLLGPGPLTEVVDGPGDAQQRELVGVLDHRDDQPPVERHRDADVDIAAEAACFPPTPPS